MAHYPRGPSGFDDEPERSWFDDGDDHFAARTDGVQDFPHSAEFGAYDGFDDDLDEDGEAPTARRRRTILRVVAAVAAAALFLSASGVVGLRIFAGGNSGPCGDDAVNDLGVVGRDVHDVRNLLRDAELYCDGRPVELRIADVTGCTSPNGELTPDQLRDKIAVASPIREDNTTGRPYMNVVLCADSVTV